jgi:multiple antibiotic resistance protein
VFKVLHLELAAFRAAGGLLLLLTAIDMLRAKTSDCRCSPRELKAGADKEDISIVPLATPLLAGPGAIATVMVLTSEKPGFAGSIPVILAVAVTFAASYFILRAGPVIARLLGTSGMAMVQRVMGLLLAAVAVQFIAHGAKRLLA